MHDIADHHVVDGNLDPRGALTSNRHGGRDHIEQLFGRVAAASLLDVAQRAREHHHRGDDDYRQRVEILRRAAHHRQRREHHVRRRRNDGQEKQDRRKGIDERICELACQRLLLAARDHVAAVVRLAVRDLIAIKAAQVRIHPGHSLGQRDGRRMLDATLRTMPDQFVLRLNHRRRMAHS